jgi:N-methylhydantoinase A
LEEGFHAAHLRQYGYNTPGEPVEMVNLTLRAVGKNKAGNDERYGTDERGSDPLKGSRPVYFGEVGDYVDCAIYDRHALRPKAELSGPAILEEVVSTTVVHPGWHVEVATNLDLILTTER